MGTFTSKVKFEKQSVETRETKSELVRNKEEGSHQNQNKRTRLRNHFEDLPSEKKICAWDRGRASVSNLNS